MPRNPRGGEQEQAGRDLMGEKRVVVMPVPSNTPINVCPCGSTDFLQKPSGEVICATCGRPFLLSIPRSERP